ncbi:hypothetical protein ABT147_44605 [Streptomyces sp. NPDC001868]|uniref:hypothetical protein n=1 Tax=Streptomyces sp. NPDC001868 TaxID=3154401 RepID=UPI00332F9A2E
MAIILNDLHVTCMGWTENKNPDSGNSDIRAGFRAAANSGAGCQGWLERKRFNPDGTVKYNWTRVSDYVFYQDGDPWRFTGYHWNGTDAGSRVCVKLTATGEQGCSYGVW